MGALSSVPSFGFAPQLKPELSFHDALKSPEGGLVFIHRLQHGVAQPPQLIAGRLQFRSGMETAVLC